MVCKGVFWYYDEYSNWSAMPVRIQGGLPMKKQEQLINYIAKKAVTCENNCRIDYKLYDEFGVKRGLRDENGKGVLVGLTNISHIHSFEENEAGERVPCDGKLWYRGYDIIDLVRGFREEGR
jgi:citrate synthase